MRFSTSAVVAAAAIGAQALPQTVNPIVQISDGQIQAPATSASYLAPSAPAATAVLPSVSPVPLPSVVPSSAPAVAPSSAPAVVPVPSSAAPVAPSAPAGTGAASAPYPVTSGAAYTNGTVLPTGAPSTSSAPAGSTSTGSPQPTSAPASGAATAFVSMGALFAGLFAFLA